MKSQYSGLQSQYSNLQSQYSMCQNQLMNLQNQYNNLQGQYQSCQAQLQQCAPTTPTLQVQAVGLTGVSSGSSATLTLLISNPSSSGVGVNGFTLGSLSCVFSSPVQVPAGTQGGQLSITLTISNGAFTGVQSVSGNGGVTVPSGITATCSGTQTAAVGIQYSGYITTVSGQTYPFTVTASS
ncbi:type IV pilin [Vulcanisaeta sp. JCM 16161]|uniref:type IV pilin n=1 Tax=Vulcanisaeta sp. JCM 16161 TaxID=1295372 RepID=UPI001FB406E1|nr:type IV pilin [Vulcanisaeta sp. JCM 16161]